MKKEFEDKGAIIDALLNNGYKIYGDNNNFAFKKDIDNDSQFRELSRPAYFHAIIEHNYPILNLHIDVPIGKIGTKHSTEQRTPKVQREMKKLFNQTFHGKLECVKKELLIWVDKYY